MYKRVPHITLKSIANNTEIDTLYGQHQPAVLAALQALNTALRGHTTPHVPDTGGRKGKTVVFDAPDGSTFAMPSGEVVPAHELQEWEVPRHAPEHWPAASHAPLEAFWQARITRQRAIDASIQARAEYEYLYDQPEIDKTRIRVAGPFTVESLSPHRTLYMDADGQPRDPLEAAANQGVEDADFAARILKTLRVSGVQQAHKQGRIRFESLDPWPGHYLAARAQYREGDAQDDTAPLVTAGILVGPEFGTLSRTDLTAAAREAQEAGFQVLIALAFAYDAQASEFNKLGPLTVIRARMHAELHMKDDSGKNPMKNTGAGNLFVAFGEPDVALRTREDGQLEVEVRGVDVFEPRSGEIRSSNPDDLACWFLDTDYDHESFFVRHAYFLGANDPYDRLAKSLKAEIDAATWATLHRTVSRPFPRPDNGYVAVKVINHLGDEVMKVLRV